MRNSEECGCGNYSNNDDVENGMLKNKFVKLISLKNKIDSG